MSIEGTAVVSRDRQRPDRKDDHAERGHMRREIEAGAAGASGEADGVVGKGATERATAEIGPPLRWADEDDSPSRASCSTGTAARHVEQAKARQHGAQTRELVAQDRHVEARMVRAQHDGLVGAAASPPEFR